MPLYQDETKKALENFQITGRHFSLHLAKNIALIKAAAAYANEQTEKLPHAISNAIQMASQEILNGTHDLDIVVDEIQGGAGTSINMNINEIIATRATEFLGDSSKVHSIDHVNMAQSTNDVIPAAMKITTYQLLNTLLSTYTNYQQKIAHKAEEFKDILKVARTHLQDAVPITLGQEFGAHASAVARDIERLRNVQKELYELNIGATAVGTGTNASRTYMEHTIQYIVKKTGIPFTQANNLIEINQYPDCFLSVSSVLTILAVNNIKFMNDLRLLSSGPHTGLGEITLRALQKGSSIMPGKVNPVMAELMNQIDFQIIGNNQTILMAIQAGQLELNVMLPIVAKNLFESLTILTNGITQFTNRTLKTIRANEEKCKQLFEHSFSVVTYLCPQIGYDKATKIVQKILATKKSLKIVLLEEHILSEEQYNKLVSDPHLTTLKP